MEDTTMYSVTNRKTKKETKGKWNDVRELDVRLYTRPVKTDVAKWKTSKLITVFVRNVNHNPCIVMAHLDYDSFEITPIRVEIAPVTIEAIWNRYFGIEADLTTT